MVISKSIGILKPFNKGNRLNSPTILLTRNAGLSRLRVSVLGAYYAKRHSIKFMTERM